MACKDDSGYVAQLKQQKSKRWYYVSAHSHRVNVLTSNISRFKLLSFFYINIYCFINLAI